MNAGGLNGVTIDPAGSRGGLRSGGSGQVHRDAGHEARRGAVVEGAAQLPRTDGEETVARLCRWISFVEAKVGPGERG